ncbi:MAG: DNA primase [Gemmatimonadetes bacterium]|nr:DNA primase [Gemmatimonadota bacterium]MYG15664.1 DNA primase [Gemmatimonadota bacterium]MYH19884.1 DNA primase [Gemmatimonadota bacterium]MYK99524.1 DNA primase [Gemmatimonadota bacterium]
MARIPEELVNSIRSQADIVDVVSDYVTLRRSGKNYMGLCPFHDEKTPSFSVNPERQIFHCFGCGKGGSVFTFLMEHENVTFVEAVHHIARRLHITIPETQGEREAGSEAESLARVTRFAARFFHDRLLNSDRESVVRQYAERRGLSEETIKSFGLGYAPDSWNDLLSAAREKGIGADWLVKAGLAKTGEQRTYDAFRKRLIFPIQAPSGRVVGFGGRALSDEDQPKYLNSPESPIYRKSQVLYGLYQARDALRRQGQALVVEGYMDLLGLHEQGIQGVVALCGTALTREQARLLARYGQQAYLVYDSDQAGVRATWRAIEPLVESGLWTRIVRLPEDYDPDSYVREHGPEGFMKLVEQADSLADFMGYHANLQAAGDRDEVFRTLAGLIRKTTNLVHREMYREEAERRFPALQGLLASELRHPTGPGGPGGSSTVGRDRHAPSAAPARDGDERVERDLVQLMLSDRTIAELVEGQLEPQDFKYPLYRRIVEQCLAGLGGENAYDLSGLIDTIGDEEAARVITELINTSDSGVHLEQRARDHIVRIKQKRLKESMARLMEQIKQMETGGRSSELNDAMATYMELKQQEKVLLRSARGD